MSYYDSIHTIDHDVYGFVTGNSVYDAGRNEIGTLSYYSADKSELHDSDGKFVGYVDNSGNLQSYYSEGSDAGPEDIYDSVGKTIATVFFALFAVIGIVLFIKYFLYIIVICLMLLVFAIIDSN